MFRRHCHGSHSLAGFTLIELLVVIAIIGVLASLILPTLVKARARAEGIQCLNNHRQLSRAWYMYVEDSSGLLPYASSTNYNWTGSDIDRQTWCTGTMDGNGNNPSNWDPEEDIMRSPMWSYTGKQLGLYKCPADRSYVVVNQKIKCRIRSMSMNLYLGGWGGTAGGYKGSITTMKIYRRMCELSQPGPVNIFVFMDMRSDSIDMGNFAVNMTGWPNASAAYSFWDLPGYYHNRACGFSFADGHSEMKRWLDSRTTPGLKPEGLINDIFPSPNNDDIAWLQFHATRPKN